MIFICIIHKVQYHTYINMKKHINKYKLYKDYIKINKMSLMVLMLIHVVYIMMEIYNIMTDFYYRILINKINLMIID